MSTVTTLPPMAAIAAAPLLGGARTSTAAALASVGGAASILGAQTDLNTAVQLAQATPQELARRAEDGDDRAKHILDQAEASRRLLSPVDLTA
jgi:hypothetical protein